MSKIKLVALDLDGTLFNNQSQITPACQKAIQDAIAQGVHVVVSTGRPLAGLPMEQIGKTSMNYAITTNGSGIYEISSQKCIHEDSMDISVILPILAYLETKDIHMDAFIHGKAYSTFQCKETAYRLDMPHSLMQYIIDTRIRVEKLSDFITENNLSVQKMTLNFYPDEEGVFVDREEVKAYLLSNPDIQCVSGGYHNLEFTKAQVTKGVGLRRLADYLNVPYDATMAIGDTENDTAILEAAAVGVAMGNATEDVKAVADYITTSNEEDGVAKAINELVLS